MSAITADPDVIREWHANLEAKRLRDLGLSYRAIGIVGRELLGVDRSPGQWRHQLSKQGAERRPRGVLPRG